MRIIVSYAAYDKYGIQKLELLFSTVESLPLEESACHEAGQVLKDLKHKGIMPPLTDDLIAVTAKRNNVAVVTMDKHFQNLPVTVINPLS